MATRTGSTTRSTSPSTAYRRGSQGSMRDDYGDNENGGSQQEWYTGNRGGVHRDIAEGIRVSAEMPTSRVARITIDIDWQSLVTRVARKVSKRIKSRNGRSTGASGRRSTASRSRTRRASGG